MSPSHAFDAGNHPVAGRLAGLGGYATLDGGGVVSIRRPDGRVVLEMTRDTWERLAQSRGSEQQGG